jgi:hypothetical protein
LESFETVLPGAVISLQEVVLLVAVWEVLMMADFYGIMIIIRG